MGDIRIMQETVNVALERSLELRNLPGKIPRSGDGRDAEKLELQVIFGVTDGRPLATWES